jgi:hypothetical protein
MSQAPYATIYLIRHAEKPFGATQGCDEQGNNDPASLIPKGWRRAGAWAVYFGPSGGLASPQRIYASPDKKEKEGKDDKVGSHSKRPVETVAELAARLNLKIDEGFLKGDEAGLANALAELTGPTLVCWQHEAIPAIAKALVGSGRAIIPDPWPDTRFDVVWRLTRAKQGEAWTFDQVCPDLLSDDSTEKIA